MTEKRWLMETREETRNDREKNTKIQETRKIK